MRCRGVEKGKEAHNSSEEAATGGRRGALDGSSGEDISRLSQLSENHAGLLEDDVFRMGQRPARADYMTSALLKNNNIELLLNHRTHTHTH